MSPHENEHHEDERLAALFASAGADPTPPDEAMLDRLREQSTKVFAEGSLAEEENFRANPSPQQKTPLPRRKRLRLTGMYLLSILILFQVSGMSALPLNLHHRLHVHL